MMSPIIYAPNKGANINWKYQTGDVTDVLDKHKGRGNTNN